MDDPIPSTDPGPAGTTQRRWPKVLLVVAGIGVVLVLGGSFLLSRFLDPDRLAAWIEPRIEAALNREVSVGALEVGILPVAVRLEGLSVSDPTGLAPELASLERLELRVRIWPLLRREVRVREIRLEGLEANLRVGPDGASNFGDFSPEGDPREDPADEGARPFALQLDEIRLAAGRLGYESAQDSVSLLVDGLEAGAALVREEGGPWVLDATSSAQVSFQVDRSAEMGRLPALSSVPLRVRLAAETPGDLTALRIHDGSLEVEEVTLALTGEVTDLKEPVRQLALAVQARGVPLADVLALLPDSVVEARQLVAAGALSGDLQVSGPVGPDTLPTVEGSVQVQAASLRMGRTSLLEDLSGSVVVAADRSLTPSVQGRLLGGALEVDGVARLAPETSVDLRARFDPDLSQVDSDLLPEGVTASGRLPGDLRVVGRPLDPPSLRFWGELGLRDVDLTHPAVGVPIAVETGRITMAGNEGTLEPTTIALGDDPVELRGTLLGLEGFLDGRIPEFRGSASGPRVSLVELRAEPLADTALTYGRVAFARVGDRRVQGRSAEEAAQALGLERPSRLPLAGEVQVALDTVLDRKGRMEDVRATVVFGPDFLQVTEATFRRYGGRIRTVAALELGEQEEEPFSLTLVAEGVDAGAFLGETTPLGRAVTGTLNLNVDLAGALDGLLLPSRSSLQGSGAFSLTGGGLDPGPLGERLADFLGVPALASLSVQDWSTGFVLRDGRIVLQEARMQGAVGTPRVGGGVGLDGDLDLVTAFDLPREDLAATALERLGIPGGGVGMETVAAVLRVGGSLADPSLAADPQATVQGVAEGVEERAREELEREVQERREELRDRATGFLRGLLGERDTVPPPPPDTVPPDTLRPDTVRPDTVPPDTLRPDTIRPDTVIPDTVRPDTAAADTLRGVPSTPGPIRSPLRRRPQR